MTFAFGHVVGLGIQEYITHHDEVKTIWQMFLAWETDLLADNPKQQKSFWLAVFAVQKFIAMTSRGFLFDWKLAWLTDSDGVKRPATELSFIINLPDGFTYKGFVDAVLENESTGEVMVLECKTTSANYVAGAVYKNSAQAIGYSIVLDVIFPHLSSYEVQYLVYKTKSQEFEALPFQKDYLSRALWIRELLLDVEILKLYDAAGVYPMHGESCNSFMRECEYLNLCTLSTESLTEPLSETDEEAIRSKHKHDFQITVSLNDLIASQLSKE